ncbi:MAG: hypothetical protein IJW05_14450 [Lentisphaeria bacterium]|nr:hypothetical protein [Lentisphaeria bacterium]MBQ7404626.1 hypothetical protein [Lentisphaeria bacterium]
MTVPFFFRKSSTGNGAAEAGYDDYCFIRLMGVARPARDNRSFLAGEVIRLA